MTAEEENLRNHLQQPGKLRDSLDPLMCHTTVGGSCQAGAQIGLLFHTQSSAWCPPQPELITGGLSLLLLNKLRTSRTECGASFIGRGEGKQF